MGVPSLLEGEGGILDHNVTSARFHVTIPAGQSATVSPAQLMQSCGVVDPAHLRVRSLVVHGANLTQATTKAKVGLVFTNGTRPINSTHRVTHVDGDRQDLVHACVTSSGLNGDHVIELAPSDEERGVHPLPSVQKGVARAARWQDVTADLVEEHTDIESVTHPTLTAQNATAGGMDKETRHLVDCTATSDSSPLTRLFQYNTNNKQFMSGKYTPANRRMVGDSKFVVLNEDLQQAKTMLKAHLQQTGCFADEGLTLHQIPLTPGEPQGDVHCDFSVIREPLTVQSLAAGMADEPVLDPGIVTIAQAQRACGDSTAPISQDMPRSAKLDAIFAPH